MQRPVAMLAMLAVVAVLALVGCARHEGCRFPPPHSAALAQGGVYVAYNLGCARGCDQIATGDLIQRIDGLVVRDAADVEAAALTDGQRHQLEVLDRHGQTTKAVYLVATPSNAMPPLRDTLPLWTVGAEQLERAPYWARRRMFAHASPGVALVSIEGGTLDGRQLYGTKRFIVYWDRSTRFEEAVAIETMQVLQKAQADLGDAGVEIMFVQVQMPGSPESPLSDSDLRGFRQRWGSTEGGQPLSPVPTYRFPNALELDLAIPLGMEHGFSVAENLGQSPAIVLLDERGIVRWHSEGVTQPPPDSGVPTPAQYTVISAVRFALSDL